VAVACYGLAVNLAVPLQQRYGALPVIVNAELAGGALVAPLALAGVALVAAGAFLVSRPEAAAAPRRTRGRGRRGLARPMHMARGLQPAPAAAVALTRGRDRRADLRRRRYDPR
jgi:hypothetical protein